MGVRSSPKKTNTIWISCHICKKKLGGTKDWEKIPKFSCDRDLKKHLVEVHN